MTACPCGHGGYAGDRHPKDCSEAVERRRSDGHVSGVNLAGFYYKPCQKAGSQSADAWHRQAVEGGFLVASVEDLDRQAGLEKCRHPNLSIVDCFALARCEDALLLTTDGELSKVKDVRTRLFPVGKAH